MANERILLVKPRWLPNRDLREHLAALHEKHPRGRFTLIAEAPPAMETVPAGLQLRFLSLPSGGQRNWCAALSLLFWLSQRRFEQSIVLTEAHHSEVGYLEAKFWALVARAKQRRLGALRDLDWQEEFTDKWQRFSPFLLARALLAAAPVTSRVLPPATPRSPELKQTTNIMKKRLHAFVYLKRINALRSQPPGVLGLSQELELWSETAHALGWQVQTVAHSDDKRRIFDVIATESAGAHWAELLAPDGLCLLLQQPTADAVDSRWEVVESHESFFMPARRDVWLRPVKKDVPAREEVAP